MNTIVDSTTSVLRRLGLPYRAFDGRVAVVTGAGRGIGKAVAEAFAALGAAVVIAELSEEGGDAAREILEAGGQALFVHTDVSDPQSVADMVKCARSEFGPVDILVNNAIFLPVAPVLALELEDWDRALAVNLRGAFLTTKVSLPGMLERGRGVIINMVSTEAMPALSAYVASKQGLSAFSRSLAAEVSGSGVHVVAFAPGFVDTPGLRETARGLAPEIGMGEDEFLSLPMHASYTGGAMPPEHAGAATAYLAAELAEEYHGEEVDGYTVLERAGLISSMEIALDAGSGLPADEGRAGLADATRRVADMVSETESEFSKLPVFVRPLARAGFRRKSGMSVPDWQNALERLARGEPAEPDITSQLEKLALYFAEVPAETARFTNDERMLAEVRAISEQRVAAVQQLVSALQDDGADVG